MNRTVKVLNLAAVFAVITVLTATAGVVTTYHPRGKSFAPVVFDDSGFVFALMDIEYNQD